MPKCDFKAKLVSGRQLLRFLKNTVGVWGWGEYSLLGTTPINVKFHCGPFLTLYKSFLLTIVNSVLFFISAIVAHFCCVFYAAKGFCETGSKSNNMILS